MTLGERLSNTVSRELGTWRFVGVLGFLTALWIVFNVNAPKKDRFDPYPFVALNLCYSFLAGITAPILLMSSARQDALDRKTIIENLELERQDNRHLHELIHKVITLEEDIEDAMKLRTNPVAAQPEWVCNACGSLYGLWWDKGEYTGPSKHMATYHTTTCNVCKKNVPCTEARDFGYLSKDWLEHATKKPTA